MSILFSRVVEAAAAAIVVSRPVVSEYLQVVRVVGAAVTAIIAGFVSFSFGMSSMGMQTLSEMARQAVRGRDDNSAR